MNIGAKAMTRGSPSKLLSTRSANKAIFSSPMRETSPNRLNRLQYTNLGDFKTVNDKVLEELDNRANQLVKKRKLSDDSTSQEQTPTSCSSASVAAAATRSVSRARKSSILQRKTHKRYSIIHRKEFAKMDSIASHYKVKVTATCPTNAIEPESQPSPAKKRRLLPPQDTEKDHLELRKEIKSHSSSESAGHCLRRVTSKQVLKSRSIEQEISSTKRESRPQIAGQTSSASISTSASISSASSSASKSSAASSASTTIPILRRSVSRSILQSRSNTEISQSTKKESTKKETNSQISEQSSISGPSLRRMESRSSFQSRNQSRIPTPTLKHSISTRSLRPTSQIRTLTKSPSMNFSSATKSSAAKADIPRNRLKSIVSSPNLRKLTR